MTRYAWSGGQAGVRRRVRAPPPGDLARDGRGAQGTGISNYSIFRHGLTLFGYFETDDIEITQELANSETNQRWSEWMDPIMKVDIDHHRLSLPPPPAMVHGLI